jgi:hypothetical protein
VVFDLWIVVASIKPHVMIGLVPFLGVGLVGVACCSVILFSHFSGLFVL